MQHPRAAREAGYTERIADPRAGGGIPGDANETAAERYGLQKKPCPEGATPETVEADLAIAHEVLKAIEAQ
jgi:hypothetical protein